jgi:hypothetical protein
MIPPASEAAPGQPQNPTTGEWRVRPLSEFLPYADTSVGSWLGLLDGERQGVVRNLLFFVSILLVAVVAAIGIGISHSANGVALGIFVGGGALGIGYAGYVLLTLDFRSTFKTKIIAPLVRFFGQDFKYEPKSCFSEDDLRASRLFGTIDRTNGEDYISGTAGKTSFACSEVIAQERVVSGQGKNAKRDWNTIFQGFFFIADFSKEFSGITVVLPSSAKSGVGEPVKLEDPEFSRLFSVFSSDQILARYILSPSLMQRLVQYRRGVGHAIQLSFVDGMLFAAMHTGHNLFEPPLFSRIDTRQFMRTFEDMHFVLSIIEELNLNTRIWTKH